MKFDFVDAFDGFSLPLDIIVNDDCIWVTDLTPLRFNKLDFKGNHLYTWLVPARFAGRLHRSPHLLGGFEGQPVRRRQPVWPHAKIRTQTRCRSEAADPRALARQNKVAEPSAMQLPLSLATGGLCVNVPRFCF